MLEPSRLRIARHRRGLTYTALARLTGLSTKSLSSYEQGLTIPEPSSVERLAAALRFPVAFFEEPPLRAPTRREASFRSLASMTAGQRDSALAAGALAFQLGAWIEKRFTLPAVDLPDLSGLHPELAAEQLRRDWAFADKPLRNLVHLLEQRGCRVFSLVEDAHAVDAFSVWHEQVPYVFLNTHKSAERGRWDAAHELGHLVLHRTAREHRPEHEDEANLFASAFLLVRSRLLATVPRAPTLDALVPHKKHWGVSLVAFVREAHRLGILSEWHARQLYVELSKRGYRRQELHGWPRETSLVLQKVLSHLRHRGRTLRDVAHDLRLEPADLEVLVFGLALLPVDGGGSSGRPPTKTMLRSV